MNSQRWLAGLMSFIAVFETIVGVALVIDPAGGWSLLLASPLDAPGVQIGRICGGALLSIGIACWCARKMPFTPTSLGVGWAYFVFSVVASGTLARFAALSGVAPPTVGAALLHGVLGAAMLIALLVATHGSHGVGTREGM